MLNRLVQLYHHDREEVDIVHAFRFIHAADLHLDSPFKGLSNVPKSIRNRLIDSTLDAFDRLIQLAVREEVDFVLFAGDIYDSADRSLRAQFRLMKGIEQLAAHRIHSFIVHGNHDPESGRKASFNWPEAVHFFPSHEVGSLVAVNRRGQSCAVIHGISYAAAAVHENLAMRIRASAMQHADKLFKIGLLHANVAGQQEHDNYAPCSLEELVTAGLDYWALGHIHKRQELHAYPFVVYPGNIQGRSMKEQGARGCYLVDVSETGEVNLQFKALDVIQFKETSIEITELESWNALRTSLHQQIEALRRQAGTALMLRLRLTGRGPLHQEIRRDGHIEELLSELRYACAETLEEEEANEHFVWIESIQAETGSIIDRSALLKQEHFLGDLLRQAEQLRGDPSLLQGFTGEATAELWQHTMAAKWLEPITDEQQCEWLREAEQLAIDLLLEEKKERVR